MVKVRPKQKKNRNESQQRERKKEKKLHIQTPTRANSCSATRISFYFRLCTVASAFADASIGKGNRIIMDVWMYFIF